MNTPIEIMLSRLHERVAAAGGRARTVADEMGVHESQLSLVLNRKRKPSRKVAKLLGYKRVDRVVTVTEYYPIDPAARPARKGRPTATA